MRILGIGGSDHDFSAALVENGNVVVAIEDERVVRKKHGRDKFYAIPTKPSIKYCLDAAKLEMDDIDYIFSNSHLEQYAYHQNLGKIEIISHHISHAACSFFPSPFPDAAIVIIDGAGSRVSQTPLEVELETISIGTGKENKIDIEVTQTGKRKIATCFWRYMTSNSIGSFYETITEAIGFGSYGAGKTMGLAPYGNDLLYAEMRDFVKITSNGQFYFNPYAGFFDWLLSKLEGEKNSFKTRANLAFAGQKIFEEAIISIISYAYEQTSLSNLCYGGGCALNSVANGKIVGATPFDDVFIYPATADNGTAIGAALYGHYVYLNNPRKCQKSEGIGILAYTGRMYSNDEILTALNNFPVYFYQPKNIYKDIANRLYDQEIVAWFQGRSEIGPRALGNRSILADPTFSRMRDYINTVVKLRETFRPLAPVVLEEDARDYFDIKTSSPFMLFVSPVKKEYRCTLGAITHIDGTARLQTVNERSNERLSKLLSAFKELRGYSVLLNTSFNARGQPIIETPEEALTCFLNTNITTLVLEDYVVEKHTPWAQRSDSVGGNLCKDLQKCQERNGSIGNGN